MVFLLSTHLFTFVNNNTTMYRVRRPGDDDDRRDISGKERGGEDFKGNIMAEQTLTVKQISLPSFWFNGLNKCYVSGEGHKFQLTL